MKNHAQKGHGYAPAKAGGDRYIETAAKLARAGNQGLSFIAIVLILLLLLYGSYSLWDTYVTYHGAFASSELLKFKPSADPGEDEANPTLDELRAINPDTCAWLEVEDTHIDYPVVQGETDMDYINKDVYGEFSLSGSIFLSCLNSPDFTDPYNLLYGHHMDNGGMFGDIVEFADGDFFSEHTTGTLFLPDATYSITLFACVETDAYDAEVYNVTAQKDNVGELIKYIKEKAVQYRDIGVGQDDSIIGLSTCAEAETNGRVIVFGRLEK